MKRIFALVIICLTAAVSVFADTVCSKDGSCVRFSSDDGAVLELKMCSQSGYALLPMVSCLRKGNPMLSTMMILVRLK